MEKDVKEEFVKVRSEFSEYQNKFDKRLDELFDEIRKRVYVDSLEITLMDVTNCQSLINLVSNFNQLTSLNTTNNTLLLNLWCFSNVIPSLDLSANTLLIDVRCYDNNMSPTATDQIYIDLANGTGINGNLQIRNNRTSASDTARATLVSRGWTFNESYTT